LQASLDRTWFVVSATMKYVGRLFTGQESTQQLGGVMSMAKGAGNAAQGGVAPFFQFLAFISVSIGLVNLFPIPMLDGGHLMFYGIEALRGKPLGPKAQEWSFRIGLGLVLMLLFISNFNDVIRKLAPV
jgi:regulator of sigma E protease